LGLAGKIKETKVNNFTKHKEGRILKITTAFGKKISVTENHKFLINNKIKLAFELKLGDKLPVPYKIDITARDIGEINLLECLDEKNLVVRNINFILSRVSKNEISKILSKLTISRKSFMNYKLRDSYPKEFILELNEKTKKEIFEKGKISFKRDRVSVPIIIKLNKSLLELIGLYVAEGYSIRSSKKIRCNQIYIASFENEILNFIKKTMDSSFGLKCTENKKDRATFSSKVVYLFFNSILKCGENAHKKRIPYMFLGLPKRKLACFLRGYFEGDGSAEKEVLAKVFCMI